MCAPTRAALLSGRNHHSVGFGSITETATAAPGYNTTRPNTKATVQEDPAPRRLRHRVFAKSHEVPLWERNPTGPFDQWPTGSGFEYFYGFIGGETNFVGEPVPGAGVRGESADHGQCVRRLGSAVGVSGRPAGRRSTGVHRPPPRLIPPSSPSMDSCMRAGSIRFRCLRARRLSRRSAR
ncbi:MAG: hypothetical protein QOE59_4746 [Actinomycetota bacterium]|jgi:hypothetical protein|nr:hypothetical protein [Actinomycetota bacterium]